MAKRSQSQPMIVASLPEETALAARAIFHIENVYLAIGNRLDGLLEGISLSDLDIRKEFHPSTSTELALLTVFQFAEDLADTAACAALPERMDWKYALHLPIQHRRLDPSLLCRFRQPLIGSAAGLAVFQTLVDRLSGVGLFGRDKRNVSAGGVLDYVCRLNQLDRLHEDVSQAIEVLACHQSDVLRTLAQPHWYDRYRHGREFRPRSTADQRAYAEALATDARHLLQTVANLADPSAKDLPEVRRLSAAWEKQCELKGTTVIWRDASCGSCPWLAEGCPGGQGLRK